MMVTVWHEEQHSCTVNCPYSGEPMDKEKHRDTFTRKIVINTDHIHTIEFEEYYTYVYMGPGNQVKLKHTEAAPLVQWLATVGAQRL